MALAWLAGTRAVAETAKLDANVQSHYKTVKKHLKQNKNNNPTCNSQC